MALLTLDPREIVRRIRRSMELVAGADQSAGQLVEMLKDTHRVLRKLEVTVDRLDVATQDWEDRILAFNLTPERLDRLEQAVFNIERATFGVEGALGMLPKVLRERMARVRRDGSDEPDPD